MKTFLFLMLVVAIVGGLLYAIDASDGKFDGRLVIFGRRVNNQLLAGIAQAVGNADADAGSGSVINEGTVQGALKVGGDALNTGKGLLTGLFGENGLLAELWNAGGVLRVIVIALLVWLLLTFMRPLNIGKNAKGLAATVLSPLGWGPIPTLVLLASVWLQAEMALRAGGTSVGGVVAQAANQSPGAPIDILGALRPIFPAIVFAATWAFAGMIPGEFSSAGIGNWVLRQILRTAVAVFALGATLGGIVPNIPGAEITSPLAASLAGGDTTSMTASMLLMALTIGAWHFRAAGALKDKKK